MPADLGYAGSASQSAPADPTERGSTPPSMPGDVTGDVAEPVATASHDGLDASSAQPEPTDVRSSSPATPASPGVSPPGEVEPVAPLAPSSAAAPTGPASPAETASAPTPAPALNPQPAASPAGPALDTASSTGGSATDSPDAGSSHKLKRVDVNISSEQPTAPPAVTAPIQPSPTTHVVSSGESLWSITASLLGPDATTQAISAQWPLLYEANADLIGPHPDLIYPGTVLTLPGPTTAEN